MNEFIPTLYYLASSPNHGPLGIFHMYGDEMFLARSLDCALSTAEGRRIFNPLGKGCLQYGWLFSDQGEVVDEVMLAKPFDAMRVLMTHGGAGIRKAVSAYLEGSGYLLRGDCDSLEQLENSCNVLVDTLLAGCLTETQISAVLEWRSGGAGPPSSALLSTHRVLLAGPPNAGKSSLLNHLAGYERAFVHPEAGATRDIVDELMDMGGYAVLVGDMPGYSDRAGGLDAAAWSKARTKLELADAMLFVVDASVPWRAETEAAASAVAGIIGGGVRVLVILNKSDLRLAIQGEPWRQFFPGARAVSVCSLPDGDAGRIVGKMAGWLFENRDAVDF